MFAELIQLPFHLFERQRNGGIGRIAQVAGRAGEIALLHDPMRRSTAHGSYTRHLLRQSQRMRKSLPPFAEKALSLLILGFLLGKSLPHGFVENIPSPTWKRKSANLIRKTKSVS